MKSLKFSANLVPLILNGSKTITWRLFDDKDLSEGDELQFINRNTGEIFGTAKVLWVREKLIKDITDKDYEHGHEKYKDTEELIKMFGSYYPDREVNRETIIKILKFEFKR